VVFSLLADIRVKCRDGAVKNLVCGVKYLSADEGGKLFSGVMLFLRGSRCMKSKLLRKFHSFSIGNLAY
jgi:hypothetical protein